MDELYIKMVLALPDEIFKDREWKVGDTFLINVKKHKKDPDKWETGTIGDSELFNGKIGYNTGWECEFEEYSGEMRLLPSQEQLQGLILTNFLKSDETAKIHDVITFFCDWYQAHYTFYQSHKEVENDSGKSIWLRYAMSVIYKKFWDGETWI